MRSRDADRFNHDADAVFYDRVVADESSLIRRGYAACLRALAEDLRRAPGPAHLPLLDLGAGTGALTAQMPAQREIIAVDISAEMLALARSRLARRPVTFVQNDLLAFVTEESEPIASVGSSFALHHLRPTEKQVLLKHLAQRMAPGARLCIGDLGFADAEAKAHYKAHLKAHRLEQPDLAIDVTEAVMDEYFWDWSVAESQLRALGMRVRRRQHGPLISSLVAMRDATPDAQAP